MSTLDVTRLIKMLNMIGSSHDGEALNAARMAHAQIKAAGITWEQLLRGAVAPRPTNQPRHGTPNPKPQPQPKSRPPWFEAGWAVWDEPDLGMSPQDFREAIRRMHEKINADLERQAKHGRR